LAITRSALERHIGLTPMTDDSSRRTPPPHRKKSGTAPPLKGQRMRGVITRILRGQSSGVLRADDDRVVYCHRSDLANDGSFNDLVVGDAVAFDVFEDRVTGPRALRLRKTP
jgi:cold shock CspA family protein